MKITDPKEKCPKCKVTHCRHYESDFDRFLKERLNEAKKEEKQNSKIAPNAYGTGVAHGEKTAFQEMLDFTRASQ